MKLAADFYRREDVVAISRELLGKVLCTNIDGCLTRAIITETEAYAGVFDKASHAYGDRRTKRTAPMYGPGGTAYVYLCYGIHHLFNVVTNEEGVPHAVLIRAGKPLDGLDWMRKRRTNLRHDKLLMAGPGTIAQALGIRTEVTGTDLCGKTIWVEDHGIEIDAKRVTVGPRVGVGYAAEDADRPYRFRVNLPADQARAQRVKS